MATMRPRMPSNDPVKVRKAVFPVAGLGTRFLPATKAQPKEMLPLLDRPVIQYVVEEAGRSGIEEVIFVTGRGKRAIEDHFDAAPELERFLEQRGDREALEDVRRISDLVQVSYVRQKEPRGLGHAVLMARPLVGDEPFAVLLGDDLIESAVPAMRQLLDVYEAERCSVLAVERIPPEKTRSYGVIGVSARRGSVCEVSTLVEKPEASQAPSDLGIVGRYVLTPAIFSHIERTVPDGKGEIQLTNALLSLLAEEPIRACVLEGTRYDTGNVSGFLRATVEFALRHEKLGPEFRAYLKTLALD